VVSQKAQQWQTAGPQDTVLQGSDTVLSGTLEALAMAEEKAAQTRSAKNS
jgi:hypothetical protein